MNYILLPSLTQAAVVRIASLLYNDCEIENILKEYVTTPKCRERIEMKTDERLSSLLPSSLRKRVAEVIHNMHYQVKEWKQDHGFLLKHIGGYCSNHLCWKTDGTVNRTQTSKKIIANENIRPNLRFIMACTYFLEDEVIAFWGRYKKAIERKTIPIYQANIAVRFWIDWLKKKEVKHWSEMIDEYFRSQRWWYPGDIPTRISCFYHLLSKESKRNIDLLQDFKVHTDDFQQCVNKMDESERIEIFRSNSKSALHLCLTWPFRSLYISMAKEVIGFLHIAYVESILFTLSVYYIHDGDEYFYLFEDFCQIISTVFKVESQNNEYFVAMVKRYVKDEDMPRNLREIVRNSFDLDSR